jgi:hypothetical protein
MPLPGASLLAGTFVIVYRMFRGKVTPAAHT